MPLKKSQPRKKPAVPLEKYGTRRDFTKTPEPGTKTARNPKGNSFVVQEHHARSHHFDFRLEIDGVLVSWAVPKGIPEDPAAKRLAVHVENHPLEYGSFEGVIPKGNYGAGTVAIWDQGTWEPVGRDWRKSFAKGKLKFSLTGKRLKGIYLLVRMEDGPNWLLRKLDEELPLDPAEKPEREVADFVSPQLARPVPTVPESAHWIHEIKFDGYRLIAVKRKGRVRLFTRTELDWTERFQELADALSEVTPKDFVMDGEAVVFDKKGRSRFGDLQEALRTGKGEMIVFVAFDLLHFNGSNLRELPLAQRLEKLAEIVPDEAGVVRRSKVWPAGDARELFKQACVNGLEGIISKNPHGRYQPGSRRDWAKSKCRARQEFVICGYTAPKGSLQGFGALVLASFENGKWIPRGKVGTGFSDSARHRLLDVFKPLRVTKAAFPHAGPGVIWLKPQLVAEIEFSEITSEGSIRQGSFVALRDDKSAPEVHLDALPTATADPKKIKAAGISISHPERLVYPADGITKLEVVRHYERVGEWMLPYVTNRPLTLLRAPDGITGETFFQKSFPTYIPAHVFQQKLDGETKMIFIKDLKGLVALAQFGVVEFHPWGARLPRADKPDFLIWDLDPDSAVPWNEVLGASLLLRDTLAELGLTTVVKTSGGKGLHILLYLKQTHEWDVMKNFAKAVAQTVAAHNPKRFIITATKARRSGKIFIDWLRNSRGSTCIAPWSLRARPGATVSMPVNWADLRETVAGGYAIREPLTPPIDWLELKPQAIAKGTLKRLGVT